MYENSSSSPTLSYSYHFVVYRVFFRVLSGRLLLRVSVIGAFVGFSRVLLVFLIGRSSLGCSVKGSSIESLVIGSFLGSIVIVFFFGSSVTSSSLGS